MLTFAQNSNFMILLYLFIFLFAAFVAALTIWGAHYNKTTARRAGYAAIILGVLAAVVYILGAFILQ